MSISVKPVKGLYLLRLIDHPEGRKAMKGWIVNTPNGRGQIVAIDEGNIEGAHMVTVFMIPGKTAEPQHQTFDAGELGLL